MMALSQQHVFETVLSASPYDDSYFLSSNNRLAAEANPKYGKKQFAIANLGTKDFITASVGISKSIPEEDRRFVIETKVYEELALDIAVEYAIEYVEIVGTGEEKERLFHVFVVDPLLIQETYTEVIDKIQYLDQIIPTPLLLKPLYTNEIIESFGAHAYIYFQEDDAFFTLYDNQEFVYTKSLKYSLREMHERFCELLGEQVPLTEFEMVLANDGLATANSEYQKYLIKLFGEIFLHINDVLTYTKRAYEIENIEHVFIGSVLGNIAGVDEYCQTYLGFETRDFDFAYGFATEQYIDQIHMLLQLHVKTEEAERYNANFTIYHRPPPFLQRHSGKLIVTTFVSLVAAFAYPVGLWTMTYVQSVHKNILEKEYQEIHVEKTTREKSLKVKNKELKNVTKRLDEENQLFDQRKNTLMKIHEVKVGYPMKGEIMVTLSKELNRFNVGVSEISYQENKKMKFFTFNLMAKEDAQITDLLKYLTSKDGNQFNFSMENIKLDNKTSYYRSQLKVVLK